MKLSQSVGSVEALDVIQAAIEALPGGSAAILAALAAWVPPVIP